MQETLRRALQAADISSGVGAKAAYRKIAGPAVASHWTEDASSPHHGQSVESTPCRSQSGAAASYRNHSAASTPHRSQSVPATSHHSQLAEATSVVAAAELAAARVELEVRDPPSSSHYP